MIWALGLVAALWLWASMLLAVGRLLRSEPENSLEGLPAFLTHMGHIMLLAGAIALAGILIYWRAQA